MAATDHHTADHGEHGGAHSRFLAHHFENQVQQFDAGKLGMWLFLVQEILFFSGLFCAYAIYRSNHPEIFVYADHFLDRRLGAINTCVLIFSSFTIAWAVRAVQINQRGRAVVLLALTFLCACGFLGIKFVEYRHKWHDGLLWGHNYKPTVDAEGSETGHGAEAGATAPGETAAGEPAKPEASAKTVMENGAGAGAPATNPGRASAPEAPGSGGAAGLGDAGKGKAGTPGEHDTSAGGDKSAGAHDKSADASKLAAGQKVEAGGSLGATKGAPTASGIPALAPLPARDLNTDMDAEEIHPRTPPRGDDVIKAPKNVHIFFGIYFAMTGLHAIHVLVGMGIIIWMMVRTQRGDFSSEYFGPIEFTGLYWHLVDLVWIYLFPLLYLIH